MRITIEIGNDPPAHGETQVVFRCKIQDKRLIYKAADLLQQSAAQFIRNVLVTAATTVIGDKQNIADIPPVDRRTADFDPDLPPGA